MRRSICLKIKSPKGRYRFKASIRALNNNSERFWVESSSSALDWGMKYPEISAQDMEEETEFLKLYLFDVLVTRRGMTPRSQFPEFKANSYKVAIQLFRIHCLKAVVAISEDINPEMISLENQDRAEEILYQRYKVKVL